MMAMGFAEIPWRFETENPDESNVVEPDPPGPVHGWREANKP